MKRGLCIILALLLLCSCAQMPLQPEILPPEPVEQEPDPPAEEPVGRPDPLPPESESDPDPEPEPDPPAEEPVGRPDPLPPESDPDSEPEPVPDFDPTPALAPIDRVVLNGQTLEMPVYLSGVSSYLLLSDLAEALQLELTVQGNTASFQWQGKTVKLARGAANLFVGSAIRSLGGAVPLWCEEGLMVPARGLCDNLQMGILYDEQGRSLYITESAGKQTIPADVRVPVLMYHCFGDDIQGDEKLYVTEENLEAQLQYLTENGFTTLFFHELSMADQVEKPIILTVDDGYLDNYTILYPLLQKYNCKATIFVVTDLIDKADHKMTSAQLKELSDSGLVSIQSHTAAHPHLRSLSQTEQRSQLQESALTLARITGLVPYAFAYPYGEYSAATLSLTRQQYAVAVRIGDTDYITGTDCHTIPRWYMKRTTTMEEFISMVE